MDFNKEEITFALHILVTEPVERVEIVNFVFKKKTLTHPSMRGLPFPMFTLDPSLYSEHKIRQLRLGMRKAGWAKSLPKTMMFEQFIMYRQDEYVSFGMDYAP